MSIIIAVVCEPTLCCPCLAARLRTCLFAVFSRIVKMTAIEVDHLNRATEIKLCSFKRPHMRGFWCATMGFFTAFVGWFAFAPLMPTIKDVLGIEKSEIYTANICAVSATIAARVVIGPMCDMLGPRRLMAGLLLIAAAPVACGAFVNNATGLILDRFFISFAGATFVPCQFWTMQMFAPQISGTANAMAGGWGNLGGGFVQAFIPGVFELFKVCLLSVRQWDSHIVSALSKDHTSGACQPWFIT